MTLAALDLNNNRVQALSGDIGQSPRVVHLDGDRAELPLILSLEGKAIEVGRAGLSLCRKAPHLVCMDFLPKLGTQAQWHHGRHRLDATRAAAMVFAKIRSIQPSARLVMLAVPGYLSREQIRWLAKIALDAGLPVAGALTRVLAAGLASYAEHSWHNVGVVVDVDEHALTCGILRPADGELRLIGQRVLPALGVKLWKEKLLARIADHCVRTSRRDPRESPDADQLLFEQLDRALDLCSQNKAVPLEVRGAHWFQTLTLQAAEAAATCSALARQVAEEVRGALVWAEQQNTTASIYLTAEAARLPGLAAALYQRCENKAPVVVLPGTAPAQAAFELAKRIDQGDLAPDLYDPSAPLPSADKAEGPEVLPFPGSLPPAASDQN